MLLPKFTDEDRAKAVTLFKRGLGHTAIAKRLGASPESIKQWINRARMHKSLDAKLKRLGR